MHEIGIHIFFLGQNNINDDPYYLPERKKNMKFVVKKTNELKGTITIDGAKNSALPILAASMLNDGECEICSVPCLKDINDMCGLMEYMGSEIIRKSKKIYVNNGSIRNFEAPYELACSFRGSFLVAAPLLSKYGYAKICMPGGCAIGLRPVDLHLKGFAAMGAEISKGNGYVELKSNRLKGAKLYLDFPSVGATENLMMAGCLADGQTTLENAATEPEITDLANFLNCMGADVKGAGTDTIRINGVKNLYPAKHTIIPDRIEAGTFMTAVAMTGGSVVLENVVPSHLKPVTAKLRETGVQIEELDEAISITSRNKLSALDIKTLPFPGFPTDMQAQFMALTSVTPGTSIIVETIFENRFMQVSELQRMGANIKIDGRTAVIEGVEGLSGSKVKATDLRAGAALVIAGLCADGETEIDDIEHIDRGYEHFEDKLIKIGADIQRID